MSVTFKNCTFDTLPTWCTSLAFAGLCPSIWIGPKVTVGPEHKVVLQPGDLTQIVGMDEQGGIYVQLESGEILGAVDEPNLKPWRIS